MTAALDGLAGIERIEVELERDAFRVEYRPGDVEVQAILDAVRELGFTPRLEASSGVARDVSPVCATLPEPVSGALETARAAGRPLFLDFFAEWCAPCHELEEEILPHPAVAQALDGFQFLRVDADESVAAVHCLDVHGLPTIVVLAPNGREMYRQVGLLEAERLASELEMLLLRGTGAR